ncbi:ankyrin repeat protein [Colletotrichum truncatum]|uniref:Ankyrin repeat protein n=1 Tax=Colletotrichum truncatum TaxID=5467 RepID=A0ACC3Z8T9_COLTU|nr:ankyrin repeat protein [Colletotrichum truncatum]KAF6789236.1 ankyrin repeat protein [Colletotrichum truncatum]
MSINWSQLDGDITRLYVSEDKSLEDTLQYLHNKYNVKITPRQFKRKYSGLKKLRATEWKAIIREIAKRETENKRCEVFLNGRKLDPARIEREKRRYGNVCEAVESREKIDLGINTIGRHRIEVRTPQPLTSEVPSPEPLLAWPSEQTATSLQQADAADQLELNVHNLLECDLGLSDLSTPRLELNYTASSSGAVSQTTGDNQTLICSNDFAFDLQSDTIAAMGVGVTQHSPFHWFQRTQSEFSLSSRRTSGHILQHSYASHDTDIPLSFLGSPDATKILANLQSRSFFCRTDLETMHECMAPRDDSKVRIPKHYNQISSYFNCIVTSFRIPPQVLLLTEVILNSWDIPSLANNREINFLIRDHGRQLLYLLFTAIVHLCCNNMMVIGGLFSFLDWLSRMDLLGQFGAFLRGNSLATHAIVDELVRRLHDHPDRGRRIPNEPVWESHKENLIALLLEPKTIQLPRRMAGRLLHAIAFTPWVKLGKILVEKGASLNSERPLTDRFNRLQFEGVKSCVGTPLCQAVMDRGLKMVGFLIDAGCDVKRQFHDEFTGKSYNALGLCLSRDYPDIDIAELLVSAGCEVYLGFRSNWQVTLENFKHYKRMSQQLQDKLEIPSHVQKHYELCIGAVEAAASGNQGLSTYLLENKVFQEETLEYILRISVEKGSDAAVQTLLRRGVNPNAPKQLLGNRILGGDEGLKGSTPIQLAASEGYYDIVYLLYKAGAKFDLEILEEIKRSIRRSYSVEHCLDLLSALLVSGVDPNLVGPFALALAIEENRITMCGFFLDLGAPMDAYGEGGQTPLQRAASEGKFEILQFLHDKGADVNVSAYRDNGRTALQAAAEGFDYNSDEILEYLLNAGADVRAPPAEEGGLTALEALANGNEFPLHRYRESVQPSWFKRFMSLGAPINRPSGASSNTLHGLIDSGSRGCLGFVLQAGARVEDRSLPQWKKPGRGSKDMTPLQYAALVVDAEAIRILLKHGADVNAEAGEEFGRTALQAVVSSAPREAVTEVVDLLLSHGADVNAPPARKGGITALQGAASTGDFQLVKNLLAHGADVNAPGAAEEGRTALEIAAEWGRLDMFRFLLSKGAVPDPVRGYTSAIELAEKNESFVVAEFLRNESILNPLDPGLWNMDFSETFQSMPTPSSDFIDVLMKEYTEI